jgi:hypothetical protein
VKLSFRPEELGLVVKKEGARPGEGDGREIGRISGTLVKSTFTGPLVSYAVDCGAGLTLVAERHKPAASDLLPVGAVVEVTVPGRAVLAFDPQTGERA